MSYEYFKKNIIGPAVLVMPPFKPNYELDLEALKTNINYIIEGGIERGKGFVICPCGTGEYVSLTDEEHKQMVKAAVEAANGKLPVVAGVASSFYEKAISLSKAAEEAGAEGVMIPPPYYYPIDQDSIYRWYEKISKLINIGVMAYNHPWRVYIGSTIKLPLMERLAELENVASMKYGGGHNLREYKEALKRFADRFVFIDNSTALTAGLGHMHRSKGFITGPAGFWPEFEAKFWSLLENREYVKAEKWQNKLIPFWNFLLHGNKGFEFNASGTFKAAMEYVGLKAGPVRSPFVGLADNERKRLYDILKEIGVKKKG